MIKVGDVIPLPVHALADESTNGWSVVLDANQCTIDESNDGGFMDDVAAAVVVAINNHDELVEALTNMVRVFGANMEIQCVVDAKLLLDKLNGAL